MTRGLAVNQVTNLQQSTYRIEELVEIYLSGQSFFYTTGSFQVSVSTATSSGAKTFLPRSYISDIGTITETFEAQATTISLQFERLKDGGSDDNFLAFLNNTDITNRRVVMYKLFRNTSTVVADTTDGLIQIFDGQISGLEVNYGTDVYTWTLRLSGDFADYDKIRGRSTADIFGAMFNKTIFWGSFYLK
jgi:hypothetical protein